MRTESLGIQMKVQTHWIDNAQFKKSKKYSFPPSICFSGDCRRVKKLTAFIQPTCMLFLVQNDLWFICHILTFSSAFYFFNTLPYLSFQRTVKMSLSRIKIESAIPDSCFLNYSGNLLRSLLIVPQANVSYFSKSVSSFV